MVHPARHSPGAETRCARPVCKQWPEVFGKIKKKNSKLLYCSFLNIIFATRLIT
jgi:hypothetical protein